MPIDFAFLSADIVVASDASSHNYRIHRILSDSVRHGHAGTASAPVPGGPRSSITCIAQRESTLVTAPCAPLRQGLLQTGTNLGPRLGPLLRLPDAG